MNEITIEDIQKLFGSEYNSILSLLERKKNLEAEVERLESTKEELLKGNLKGWWSIKPIKFESRGNSRFFWADILLSDNGNSYDERQDNDNYNGMRFEFCYKIESDTLEVKCQCFNMSSNEEIISEECQSKEEAEILTRLWLASVVAQFQGADWRKIWGFNSCELSNLCAQVRAYIKKQNTEGSNER